MAMCYNNQLTLNVCHFDFRFVNSRHVTELFRHVYKVRRQLWSQRKSRKHLDTEESGGAVGGEIRRSESRERKEENWKKFDEEEGEGEREEGEESTKKRKEAEIDGNPRIPVWPLESFCHSTRIAGISKCFLKHTHLCGL